MMKYYIILPSLMLLGFNDSSQATKQMEKTNIEDVRQKADDLKFALKEYTIAKREELLKKAEVELNKIDEDIEDLQTRLNKQRDVKKQQVSERMQEHLNILRKKRIQVAERYGSLKTSTANSWEITKRGFSAAYQDLYSSWQSIKDEFEDAQP